LLHKAKIPRQRLGFSWPGDLLISGYAYEFSSLRVAIEKSNLPERAGAWKIAQDKIARLS
jgi:hypothetical protein